MTAGSAPPPIGVDHVSIGELRPDPANPRHISEDEMEALTRSVRNFGFVQPVLARREDKTVIGGHQRLLAARRLGLKTVPVIFLDLTVEQARLLNLALNKISGSWDEALLARLLADLQAVPDIDFTLTGFDEAEIRTLLRSLETREKQDRPEHFDLREALEAATREPRAKPGDVWQCGPHPVMCGDSTNSAMVTRLMSSSSANIAFTDPP